MAKRVIAGKDPTPPQEGGKEPVRLVRDRDRIWSDEKLPAAPHDAGRVPATPEQIVTMMLHACCHMYCTATD